jgi:hypothetical protein
VDQLEERNQPAAVDDFVGIDLKTISNHLSCIMLWKGVTHG